MESAPFAIDSVASAPRLLQERVAILKKVSALFYPHYNFAAQQTHSVTVFDADKKMGLLLKWHRKLVIDR